MKTQSGQSENTISHNLYEWLENNFAFAKDEIKVVGIFNQNVIISPKNIQEFEEIIPESLKKDFHFDEFNNNYIVNKASLYRLQSMLSDPFREIKLEKPGKLNKKVRELFKREFYQAAEPKDFNKVNFQDFELEQKNGLFEIKVPNIINKETNKVEYSKAKLIHKYFIEKQIEIKNGKANITFDQLQDLCLDIAKRKDKDTFKNQEILKKLDSGVKFRRSNVGSISRQKKNNKNNDLLREQFYKEQLLEEPIENNAQQGYDQKAIANIIQILQSQVQNMENPEFVKNFIPKLLTVKWLPYPHTKEKIDRASLDRMNEICNKTKILISLLEENKENANNIHELFNSDNLFKNHLQDILKIELALEFNKDKGETYKLNEEEVKENLFTKFLSHIPILGPDLKPDKYKSKLENNYNFLRKFAITLPFIGKYFHKEPILESHSLHDYSSNFNLLRRFFEFDQNSNPDLSDKNLRGYTKSELEVKLNNLWREDLITNKWERLKNFCHKYKKLMIAVGVIISLVCTVVALVLGILESMGFAPPFAKSLFVQPIRFWGSFTGLFGVFDILQDIPHILFFITLGTAISKFDKYVCRGYLSKICGKIFSILDEILFFVPYRIIEFVKYEKSNVKRYGVEGAFYITLSDLKHSILNIPNFIKNKWNQFKELLVSIKEFFVPNKNKAKDENKKEMSAKESFKEEYNKFIKQSKGLKLNDFTTEDNRKKFLNDNIETDKNRILDCFAYAYLQHSSKEKTEFSKKIVYNELIKYKLNLELKSDNSLSINIQKRSELIDKILGYFTEKDGILDISVKSQPVFKKNNQMAQLIYNLNLYKEALTQLDKGGINKQHEIMMLDSMFSSYLMATRNILIARDHIKHGINYQSYDTKNFVKEFIATNPKIILNNAKISKLHIENINEYLLAHNKLPFCKRTGHFLGKATEIIDVDKLPKLLALTGVLYAFPPTRIIFTAFEKLNHSTFHFLHVPDELFEFGVLGQSVKFIYTYGNEPCDLMIHLLTFEHELKENQGLFYDIVNDVAYKVMNVARSCKAFFGVIINKLFANKKEEEMKPISSFVEKPREKILPRSRSLDDVMFSRISSSNSLPKTEHNVNEQQERKSFAEKPREKTLPRSRSLDDLMFSKSKSFVKKLEKEETPSPSPLITRINLSDSTSSRSSGSITPPSRSETPSPFSLPIH